MGAHEATGVDLAIRGPIARSDLPGLYRRVCMLLESARPSIAYCDVGRLPADAVAVDALSRLALAGRRHGCRVRLRRVSPELRELIELMGLESVLLR